MKHWEKQQVKAYRKHLKELRHYTDQWIANRVIEETNILYDETVNSIVPLRIHSKRSGKFDQVVFRGSVTDKFFVAGFYLDGKLAAAASVGKARELIRLGQLLEAGKSLSPEQLKDPDFNLLSL